MNNLMVRWDEDVDCYLSSNILHNQTIQDCLCAGTERTFVDTVIHNRSNGETCLSRLWLVAEKSFRRTAIPIVPCVHTEYFHLPSIKDLSTKLKS